MVFHYILKTFLDGTYNSKNILVSRMSRILGMSKVHYLSLSLVADIQLKSSGSVRKLIKDPGVMLMFLSIFVIRTSSYGLSVFLPHYLIDTV